MPDLFDSIRDTADALTEPHQHTERIRDWDLNRNAKYRNHTTVQPGLLRQLYVSVVPSEKPGESGAATVPGSRPPLALEALSRHVSITAAVNRWCWTLNLGIRPHVESNLRQLAAAAQAFDEDTARTLLSEMRQWKRWCAVLTGWERIYQPAGVPCPVPDCSRTNTLRINLTNSTAMCKGCTATWAADDGSITVLAQYIRTLDQVA